MLLFSQSFGRSMAALQQMFHGEGERKVTAQGTEKLYGTVDDSSVFRVTGNHFTLAEATYLVDRNGLEEFLPPPQSEEFQLCQHRPITS